MYIYVQLCSMYNCNVCNSLSQIHRPSLTSHEKQFFKDANIPT